MGYYVDPSNEDKEVFLQREGIRFLNGMQLTWKDVPTGCLPVILVTNPIFSAALIVCSEVELSMITRRHDTRPTTVYLVEIEKIKMLGDPDFNRYAERNGLI